MSLYQIYSDHFVAGFEANALGVASCAPIIKYMHLWPLSRVLDYCKKKKWVVKYVGSY